MLVAVVVVVVVVVVGVGLVEEGFCVEDAGSERRWRGNLSICVQGVAREFAVSWIFLLGGGGGGGGGGGLEQTEMVGRGR